MSEMQRLLDLCMDIDKRFADDLPMLLIIGDLPYAETCPPESELEFPKTHEDDWWSDGIAYSNEGEFDGTPAYVVEPTEWVVGDDGASISLKFTLEGRNGMVAEFLEIELSADDLDRCVAFINKHDEIDKTLFDRETFMFYKFD